MPVQPFLLFYSYSSKDEQFREELDEHLAALQREKVVSTWSFRRILPGDEWDRRINEKLNEADIILLMVSAHFLASEYCVGVEVKRALQRHDRGDALVIPVILSDCDWKTYDFAKLQALPTLARPVTSFGQRDSAWTDVAYGVRQAAGALADRHLSRSATESRLTPSRPLSEPTHQPTDRAAFTDATAVNAATEFAPPTESPGATSALAGVDARKQTSRNRKKLLAIEDDAEVLALYKSYLQKRGYEVLGAKEALEGMKIIKDNPDVGLVLLDLNLPGISGEEWFAWFRRYDTVTPVVIASGRGDILPIAKSAPNTSALTKPFYMEELQELLEVLLQSDWLDEVSIERRLH